MKFENNWRSKSLAMLEKDDWGMAPEGSSGLVVECMMLRKRPLDELSLGNIRMLIGQAIGLYYLIPLALERLQTNLFAEGDCYEGDILSSVLQTDHDFWQSHPALWNQVDLLIRDRLEEIQEVISRKTTDKFYAFTGK